ncbi:unnamed protein product [Protopolystoma xenopodis]|uniref:ELYS beta-propeller domain-containing protein n=1 Tax=Protopolystoma xenopodis TaxID=117903 RepID=A0A448WGJ5_9PLAT|nr:unnamed protein product [Protopolystoma xenopodis]
MTTKMDLIGISERLSVRSPILQPLLKSYPTNNYQFLKTHQYLLLGILPIGTSSNSYSRNFPSRRNFKANNQVDAECVEASFSNFNRVVCFTWCTINPATPVRLYLGIFDLDGWYQAQMPNKIRYRYIILSGIYYVI